MTDAAFDLATTPLDPGTVLLEASAGTGKTYTLVGILLRLLVEGRIERLDQALVVTFTVAATDELKNRLRKALRAALRACAEPGPDAFLNALAKRPGAAAKFAAALATFDQVAIATIHGFCKRLLEEAAFESHEPFAVEFTPDPLPLLQRAAADALRLQYEPGITTRSALVHVAKFEPNALVETYRLWRRYPDAVLPPDPPDLAPALAAIDAGLQDCVATCDDAALAGIAGITWKDGRSPFALPLAVELPRLRERLQLSPALVLPTLCALGPRNRETLHHRRSTSMATYQAPFFAACDRLAAATDAAVPHLRAELLRAMHQRVELGKQDEGVATFDDLLLRAHAAIVDPERRPALLGALRARHTVGLIDEFQDTDSLQYRIFADCFAERTLFLIGDPKQAIYGFRGADLRTYLKARREAVRHYTLAQNHRSAAPLVDAVTQWFRAHPRPFVDDGISVPKVTAAAAPGRLALHGDGDAVLRFRFATSTTGDFITKPAAEALVAKDVAAEAARLLTGPCRRDGAPLQPHHIAVLTRTNHQATLVQEALRKYGIPSAIGKAGDIFLTDEFAELQRFLLAVLQPSNLRRVRAAMATRLWGLDAATLVGLEGDEARFDEWLERLAQWRRLWLRHGFIVMQEQALVDLAVHERFLRWHAGERRLTNFRQLFELLHDAEHTHRLSPEGLCEWLAHERHKQEDLDYTLRELRLESDGDAVQILTVHGSKGLQYEVVFCPFLWAAIEARPGGTDVAATETGHEVVFRLVKKHPQHAAIARQRLEEELRLAYVAVTRAVRRCYVYWGHLASSAASSAVAWLVHGTRTVPGLVDGKEERNWLEVWQKRCEDDHPQWLPLVHGLAAASGGTIDVTTFGEPPQPTRIPQPVHGTLPQPRRPERQVRAHSLHSFSSLVARSHDAEPAAATESDRPARNVDAAGDAIRPRGIFAFARGPQAGQCLHTILERIDLQNAGSPEARTVVQDVLRSTGLAETEAHAGDLDPVAAVQQALQDLAAARAHAGGPSLAALCSGPRAIEWQFTLPALDADFHALARILAASPGEAAQRQAQRLLDLPSHDLRGFLVGFADLVLEHDGRFWVIDWKSNHLGNDAQDYAADRLLPAMVEHDYVLQYHLYVLALHRQLRARRRDYDPERHLGGVVYAFLRGAVPDSTCGMFFDRVPTPIVERMDRWLAGQREVPR
ncbi:MAG: UvrD-helicase domain-containing protein [Planctomycetes bacterium]|nr:UvrD-helicase domain-containing protein [Planctomycetota bacterium]